jgi:hypothetical protein
MGEAGGGRQTSADTGYLFTDFHQESNDIFSVYSQALDKRVKLEAGLLKPVIRSGHVGRYYGEVTALVLFPYEFRVGNPVLLSAKVLESQYPKTWEYLGQNETLLRSRESGKFDNKGWYQIYPKNLGLWEQPKLMMPYMIDRLAAYPDYEDRYFVNVTTGGFGVTVDEKHGSLDYFSALFNSNLLDFYLKVVSTNFNSGYFAANKQFLVQLPIKTPHFTTPADERERLVREITEAYDLGDTAGALSRVRAALAAGQTDVVHDVLAHLAQTMIDLNNEKQAEVGRFLGWLEGRLKIAPKDGKTGLDVFAGKTIIQGYLGDYQKGESELPWDDFLYRLHQNRNRYAATLAEVEGEIQREYEGSLETLLPVKDQLARTDALIDKIVYRLYGLTDAEIELIERPGYEQALTDAKADVINDKKMQKKDDEEKLEKIAEGILPAAKRFFERVTPADVEAALDGELPNWRDLPPDAPVFLLTGDYNLRSLPDHMDFSSSVIPYTKAVEVVLDRLVFQPFRASSYTDKDCHNKFLQAFMRGEKSLTLGAYMIILSSSKETALRSTMQYTIPDVDGFVAVLTDAAMRDVRNKAAHDEVLSRDEARQARAWAVGILGMV